MHEENLSTTGKTKRKLWLRAFLAVCSLASAHIWAQSANSADDNAAWQVPISRNLMPHFEEATDGRKILYVDGQPFAVLAVEIPWWDLIYGKYKETESTYDDLYPAAANLGLNALKVPVKWSMVEPEMGVYDFSYIDHAKAQAEQNHLK